MYMFIRFKWRKIIASSRKVEVRNSYHKIITAQLRIDDWCYHKINTRLRVKMWDVKLSEDRILATLNVDVVKFKSSQAIEVDRPRFNELNKLGPMYSVILG